MRVLVIPSIRQHSLTTFLEEWKGKGGWDKVVLVEDNETKTFDVKGKGVDYHYSHQEIAEILGEDTWIISKKDSAVRCFGFLAAYWLGADYILSLDDDCGPYPMEGEQNLFQSHIDKLESVPRWVPSVPDTRTRGLPYKNLGTMQGYVNMGYWTNVADYDSLQSFARFGKEEYFIPPTGNRVIPSGQYFPYCGMNIAFRRKATPLMYFPLMGQGQQYKRFDDIYCGIIAKKIADHLRWPMTVGEPFIEHQRASDPFVNLVKEAPGIVFNEKFWEIIDGVRLTESGATEAVEELGDGLVGHADEYVSKLGKALRTWAGFLQHKPTGL